MAELPADLRYTEEHEYVARTDEAGVYRVGITDYAQGELGDIVYIELPTVGETVERMATFGTVEAVKAVSDLYMPVSGEVVAVNDELQADPSLVNSDPYGRGWMIHVRVRDESEVEALLDAEAYGRHIG